MDPDVKASADVHTIREFDLEKVNLIDEFDILQIVGEGWFGKILLVEHKATDKEMVLKALPKPYTALCDFYREFHYGLYLGVHKNIITTYDVTFETPGFYIFSQEYAPLGDLTSNVSDAGIGELHAKRVAKQLAAALEYLHSKELVHRDVKLDNILVFKSDFSRIKLCDFGETKRNGSIVLRRNEWLPYAPPEVLQIKNDKNYKASTVHDIWQYGIVIFVCLTGCLPWQKAALDDPRYARYISWQSSAMPIRRQPKLFKLISTKAQKLFKKLLEPRYDRRPTKLLEMYKSLDDRWISKSNVIDKYCELNLEDNGLCPSMYSFHSSPEEKHKLLFTLTQYGIETTVDRIAKKNRICQWIQTSIIEEDEEEDEIDEVNEKPKKATVEKGIQLKNGKVYNYCNQNTLEVEEKKSIVRLTTENERNNKEKLLINLNKKHNLYIPPIDPRISFEMQKVLKEKLSTQKKTHDVSENSHIENNIKTNDNRATTTESSTSQVKNKMSQNYNKNFKYIPKKPL